MQTEPEPDRPLRRFLEIKTWMNEWMNEWINQSINLLSRVEQLYKYISQHAKQTVCSSMISSFSPRSWFELGRDTCWRTNWSSPQCKTQILKTVVEWCYFHLIYWLKIYVSHAEQFTEWLTVSISCKNKAVAAKTLSPVFTQEWMMIRNGCSVSHWHRVTVGVSKLDYTDLIFVKVNEICYCHVLLS